jgi:FAD/FMN-containing dehydrogenase
MDGTIPRRHLADMLEKINELSPCLDNISHCIRTITHRIKPCHHHTSQLEAAEGFANVGYPLDAQALLLCELDGTKAQVQAELESVLKVLSGASSLKVSESEKERLNLWKGRKSAFPAVGRLSPDYFGNSKLIFLTQLINFFQHIC